jgi:hypothetical protein
MKLQFEDYLNLSKVYYSPAKREVRLFEENRLTALLLNLIDEDRNKYLGLDYAGFQSRVKKEARLKGLSISWGYPDWINLFVFTQTSIKSIVITYLCLLYLKKPLSFPINQKELNNLTETQKNHIYSII